MYAVFIIINYTLRKEILMLLFSHYLEIKEYGKLCALTFIIIDFWLFFILPYIRIIVISTEISILSIFK